MQSHLCRWASLPWNGASDFSGRWARIHGCYVHTANWVLQRYWLINSFVWSASNTSLMTWISISEYYPAKKSISEYCLISSPWPCIWTLLRFVESIKWIVAEHWWDAHRRWGQEGGYANDQKEKTTAGSSSPAPSTMFTSAHQSIDIVWDIFPGPFDRPCDSKSSLVQFATTKIRGLVVCKGGYLRGGCHPDWNLIQSISLSEVSY